MHLLKKIHTNISEVMLPESKLDKVFRSTYRWYREQRNMLNYTTWTTVSKIQIVGNSIGQMTRFLQ